MSDYIDRKAAIEAVNGMPDCPNGFSGTYDKDAIIGILEDVPSVEELKSEALETAYLEGYTAGQNAQPKYVALHESCTDCPLYDRKNYNCPRFNRVIPMAIRDAQTQVKALSLPSVQPDHVDDYKTDHGFMWLCPNCGLVVHSDFNTCVRCGKERPIEPQRWIPVSEALPPGQELVNVSCHDDSGDTAFDYKSCGWMTTDGEYWIVDNEINSFVVAWMPLPEPWEGQDDT